MKTVGIIGGLGPETTAKFYLKLIFACFKQNVVKRPPVLMWSIPIEYQTEDDFIIKNHGAEKYIPYLLDAAKRLENGGADFLVLPCNSVHIFIEKIRNSVKIPVLSIVEETTNFLTSKGVSRVGLLATTSTINNKIYHKPLEENGIKIILPEEKDQTTIGKLIKRLVLGEHAIREKRQLLKIIERLKMQGTDKIILACTDLQLLVPPKSISNVFDSMEILLEATKQEILN